MLRTNYLKKEKEAMKIMQCCKENDKGKENSRKQEGEANSRSESEKVQHQEKEIRGD